MSDKRKQNGGARPGAGRKPKRNEEKQNAIFIQAAKEITNEDIEDEAKVALLVQLWNTSSRGQLFVAEHIFGKPKEQVEVTNINEYPDLSGITTEELEQLIQEESNDD